MRRYQQLAASRKRETNKTLSIQKVKSTCVSLAAVHCQVVMPTVLKPVCMMPCRNYHCLDRTHARTHARTHSLTHSHLQLEHLAIDQPPEDQCAQSHRTDICLYTETATHSYTELSFFRSRFCLPQ